MRSLKMSVLAVVTMSVAAACGSSTVPSTAGTPTIGPTGVPTPTATSPASSVPTATVSATATPTIAPTATVAATSGAIDLCSLLTAADVTTVLGGGWAEGVMANDYCHWDSSSNPNERVVTFVQAGTIDAISAQMTGGTSVTVAGHGAYSFRDLAANVQTTYIDIGGGQLLIVEIPNSSDSIGDLQSAVELIEAALGNL